MESEAHKLTRDKELAERGRGTSQMLDENIYILHRGAGNC